MRANPLLPTMCVLALSGCGGATDPELTEVRVLGTIEYYNDPVAIVSPDTVVVGQAFDVHIRTYGGGCHRIGPTETTVVADTVFVTPYDYTKGSLCTDVLNFFDHVATLSWSSVGHVTLVFRGMKEPQKLEQRHLRQVVTH